MDELFEMLFNRRLSYPRFGEIRRYRVVPEDDYDIVPKKSLLLKEISDLEGVIKRRKKLIEDYTKRTEAMEKELEEKKLKLK